jgi:hypothetical protein
MGAAFAYIGTFLLSLFVALLATLQLGDHFGAAGEFIVVLLAIPVFVMLSMVCFGITMAAARTAHAFNVVAVLLALLAIVLVALPVLIEWRAGGTLQSLVLDRNNIKLTLELIVPALIAVLIQWGLLRQRWLRAHGGEELSRWPWAATVIGGLVVLNPVGLDFIHAALRQSPTDWLRQFAAMVTGAGAVALLVVAWIEYYIRGRVLRRRLTGAGVLAE